MKKALLSFLLLVACTSFAMAQHVERQTVSACQTYTWSINGETYTNDTVVATMNSTLDTIFVLNLTINTPYTSYDTIVPTACKIAWRNDTIVGRGIFRDTVLAAANSGHCDSVFNLVINTNNQFYDTVAVNACARYIWNNDTLTSNGYYDDTTTYVGAVYGGLHPNIILCNEFHTLDLTLNPNHVIADTMEMCNATYTWHGDTITTTGDYYDTIPAIDSICDTVYALNFTLVDHKSIAETIENCGNYTWHNNTLTTTGTYTDTVADAACDTIYTLNLTVTNSVDNYDTIQQCGKYTWHGIDLVASNDYDSTLVDTLTNCSTIDHLHLVITVDTVAQTAEACGEKLWNYTHGIRAAQMTDTLTTTGFYSHIVTDTVSLCNTYTSMNATIRQPRQGDNYDTITACNTYYTRFTSINGKTDRNFYESIDFDTILKDHRLAICADSNIHFHITINKSFRDTVIAKACGSYYWNLNQKTYTKTPTTAPKAYYGSDSNGCDSISVLMLVVKKTPVISAINGEWNLAAGDTAVLYPTCTGNPAYTWSYNNQTSHNDTLIIPDVQGNFDVTLYADLAYNNVDTLIYANSDTTQAGDTIFNDIQLVCSDTSWISIVTYVGIDGVSLPEVSLYPNPTVGQLNIESAENVQEVAIFNTIGQQVAVKHNLGTNGTMNLSNLAKGTYTMRLLLQNGETVTRKFVITK